MTYRQRYCAFVDILGFRSIIDESRGDTKYIRDLLHGVHNPSPMGIAAGLFAGSDLRAQSISDAVCLTAAPTGAGLNHLFTNLEVLALDLLQKGRFVRGGIVKGDLYEEDGMVFGPALAKAYSFESTVARFPRIVIEKAVRDEALTVEIAAGRPLQERILQSEDGPYFLHVLSSAKISTVAESIDFLNTLAEQIQLRLDESVDTPAIFEKVRWFAEYWNSEAHNATTGVKAIRGAGLGFSVGDTF